VARGRVPRLGRRRSGPVEPARNTRRRPLTRPVLRPIPYAPRGRAASPSGFCSSGLIRPDEIEALRLFRSDRLVVESVLYTLLRSRRTGFWHISTRKGTEPHAVIKV
jgi:hypothetical protein